MTAPREPKTSKGREPAKVPVLVPPDEPGAGRSQAAPVVPMLVAGVGLLLALAALAVLFLPMLREQPAVPPLPPAQPVSAPPAKLSVSTAAPSSPAASEVAMLVDGWLKKQAAAEADNVAAWGGEAYAAARALASDCDRLLGEQQLRAAGEACEAAVLTLDELMRAKPALLEEALQGGLRQLEKGEPVLAAESFRRAQAIDPGNAAAAAGLRRSAVLPEVLRLMTAGLDRESAGDLPAALALFREATSRDPDFPPAAEARDRTRAALAGQQFRQAMSLALQGLADGRLDAAEQALQQAQALRPGDPAAVDLQQQLSRARLTGRLDRLRREAERLEGEERWAAALRSCEQMLELDPLAAFALSCRARVTPRLDLERRLEKTLAQPERLYDEGPLAQARDLVAAASVVQPVGPRLSAQLVRLRELIRLAEAEVEVVLRSDGLTEVSIYHVGRLGRFLEKTLLLRTGNYTAIGRRNGFRDIRRSLEVRPGSEPLTFTLRCEEPI